MAAVAPTHGEARFSHKRRRAVGRWAVQKNSALSQTSCQAQSYYLRDRQGRFEPALIAKYQRLPDTYLPP
jgi:transposase-like protein